MMSRMLPLAWCMTLVVGAAGMLAPEVAAQESVPLSRFEGTWVGLQTWTVDNPSAQEPQPVTLTLELVDGQLQGSMTPFLGLARGVAISDARIVNDELHLTATGRGRGWQAGVGVEFRFMRDAETMTGTGELTLGEVDWLDFDYDLSLKRSRY